MSKTIQIRPAQLADIKNIQTLLRQTWFETYAPAIGKDKVRELSTLWHSDERLKFDIARDNMTFLVAERNNELVATASLTIKETRQQDTKPKTGAKPPIEAVVGRMYVHPSAQNEGLGAGLLSHLLAPLVPGTRLSLTVEPHNKGAIEFYSRFGFSIEGPGSCSDDPHDDVPTLIMTAIKT
ncbi:MAG: hypothetical protein DHS20C08_19740 [Rhodomicrobium sp.]|nr:MAG: hypothetical protein DHS20C08_19740 [Rhodomicrobium sp.]